MLAGHLPFVWDQKGPTTDKIADEVKEFLGTKGITATAAVATAAFVRANTDGAERLVVDLQLTSGDVIKAQVALNQMVAIGGRDAKTAALLREHPIRFACVCARAGATVSTVDIPRAVAAATADAAPAAAGPPPGRRRKGQLRSLDVLRQRRRARRLGQQPDSRSRRRPAHRGWRRDRRRRGSRGAARSRVHRHRAADRASRPRASPRPTASRSSSSSACRIRSSIS